VKHHLYIIITIVLGFTAFMAGYSYSPFMEVGFAQQDEAGGADGAVDADLMRQYEQLYESDESEQ